MISTILFMISAIHDLVLVYVVVTNCSLGHGLEVRVSEHYLRIEEILYKTESGFPKTNIRLWCLLHGNPF